MAITGHTLPPAFTSLYRLFLRAVKSSVLQNPAHTRHLRSLYRPTFEQAVKVIRELENGHTEQEPLRKWLDDWQIRGMLPSVCFVIRFRDVGAS